MNLPRFKETYPSDLTEEEWQHLRPLLPKEKGGGRPRSTSLREVINAVRYLNRTGCPWRYIPHSFPPWQTVYVYFYRWSREGVWEKINRILVMKLRQGRGKKIYSTLAIVDSQSVRAHYGKERGWAIEKK